MKKLLLSLVLLFPFTLFAQNFELGINGGISINTLPVLLKSNPFNAEYKQSGVNPFFQIYANHKIDKRLKAGIAVNYLTATASETWQTLRITHTKTGMILNPVIQIMPELIFFVESPTSSFDFGIQVGASIYSAGHSNVGIVEVGPLADNFSNIKAGYCAGIILRASHKLTKSLSLNISLNPIYNHLQVSKNINRNIIPNQDYSFFTIPVSLGISFSF